MPKMTSEQIDALVAGDDEQLIRTVLAYQQREYGNLLNGVPEDMQIGMIRNGIAKARSYGLQRAGNINAFVALMFEIAPEFDRQPDIQRVLKDPTIAPENKIQALMDRVPAQAWEDAGKHISSQTWFPELRDQKD
jgi:hypothetical protein